MKGSEDDDDEIGAGVSLHRVDHLRRGHAQARSSIGLPLEPGPGQGEGIDDKGGFLCVEHGGEL